MINRVVLVGRLTKDTEVRTTQGGLSVVNFNLAVNRQFTNSDGDREADFIQCIIWRKAAESFGKYTHKGSLVGIDGRIQTHNYENKQGQRVYVTEVVVDNFSLLESRKMKSSQSKESENEQNRGNPESSISTETSKKQEQESAPSNDMPLDIDDSEFPF